MPTCVQFIIKALTRSSLIRGLPVVVDAIIIDSVDEIDNAVNDG